MSTYLHGACRTAANSEDIDVGIEDSKSKIQSTFEKFQKQGSGWSLEKIDMGHLHSVKYSPISGTANTVDFQIPANLYGKRGLKNVRSQNGNDDCFLLSVAACIPQRLPEQRLPFKDENLEYQYYKKLIEGFNMENVNLPMEIDKVENNIS